MMVPVLHVTSGLGLRKFQANGFLLDRVYKCTSVQMFQRESFFFLYEQSIRNMDSEKKNRNFSLS